MNRHLTWLAAAAAFLALPAQAQQSTLKVGVARIDIHSSTTGLKGVGVPRNADIEVEDATTLYLAYEYRFMPNWGVELAGGLPPRHDTKAKGSIAFLGKVSSVRQAGPGLFLNYHFGEEGAALRPYIGAGVNYTKFFSAKSEYGQNIELSDSIGPAVQVGLNYSLGNEWGLFASVATARVKSDLVATASTVQTTTINFKPVAYAFGASYKF